MHRRILLLAAMMASSAAHGAPPEIAYATASSRGDAVYLVNPNGGSLTKLYQGRSTSRFGSPINSIALRLRPEGGGEVAFVEGDFGLKIVRHDDNGQPVGTPQPITVPDEPGCVTHDIDYLANGTLVIVTGCSLWTLAPNATTATPHPVIDSPLVQSIAAIGNSLLYIDNDDLKRLDGTTVTTVKSSLSPPFFYLDATSDTAFLSDRTTFQTVGLTSPNPVNAGCTQGGMVELSPSGSEMLYFYRNQLLLGASNCIGQTPSRLARGVRSFAWRTY